MTNTHTTRPPWQKRIRPMLNAAQETQDRRTGRGDPGDPPLNATIQAKDLDEDIAGHALWTLKNGPAQNVHLGIEGDLDTAPLNPSAQSTLQHAINNPAPGRPPPPHPPPIGGTGGVGDIQAEGHEAALKAIAVTSSIIVYVAMLLYTAVHNFTLMLIGIPPDLQVWAILGVVTLEISAIALPIALHWWTHAPIQRIVAFLFYAIDLLLLWINVSLDFALVAGTWTTMPEWMTLYLHYVMPATPLLAGAGWALLWLLDPSQQERSTRLSIRTSAKAALARRISAAANTIEIDEMVDAAATELARHEIAKALGVSLRTPNRNGRPEARGNQPRGF